MEFISEAPCRKGLVLPYQAYSLGCYWANVKYEATERIMLVSREVESRKTLS
jgi:hypothetical protein